MISEVQDEMGIVTMLWPGVTEAIQSLILLVPIRLLFHILLHFLDYAAHHT